MALPGCVYVYQGDELGLWEVEDIPAELRQDPTFIQTGGADLGRDGCRVPLPWAGDTSPFGFSPTTPAPSDPWLPQPNTWKGYTVATQTGDPDSMLELYRRALHIRREQPDLRSAALTWLPSPDGVLAFARGDVTCIVNFTETTMEVPGVGEPLIVSGQLVDGRGLPADTAVWLRTG